jgi:hypothetical protein
MKTRRDGSLVLVVCGLVAILIACVDPLEGFPLVLGGGLLLVIATHRAVRARLRLAVWGLALAVVGCVGMLVLSALGGVGGTTGRSPVWFLLAAPYPVGALLLLAAGFLSLGRARKAARRR